MDYFMVNWSARPVPAEHMLVMRIVASQMLTGIIDHISVDFTHDICAGRLTKKNKGIYGGTGGTFFLGDFGQLSGYPNTVTFFVPSGRERLRLSDDSLVTRQAYDENSKPVGYPEDVDVLTVKRGRIKISNKHL